MGRETTRTLRFPNSCVIPGPKLEHRQRQEQYPPQEVVSRCFPYGRRSWCLQSSPRGSRYEEAAQETPAVPVLAAICRQAKRSSCGSSYSDVETAIKGPDC